MCNGVNHKTEDYGSKLLINTPPVSLRQLLYINSLIAAH